MSARTASALSVPYARGRNFSSARLLDFLMTARHLACDDEQYIAVELSDCCISTSGLVVII